MIRTFLLAFSAVILLNTVSCKKEKGEKLAASYTVYVVNEGRVSVNESSITAYSTGSGQVTTDAFQNANGRMLGIDAYAIAAYGSKMYVPVCLSDYLEIMDKRSAKSIQRVALRRPSDVVFYGRKAYISTSDGIAVLDTATLAVEKTINTGSYVTFMSVANGKLYVTGDGTTVPNVDFPISVIDLTTQTKVKSIPGFLSPFNFVADQDGYVYVTCSGLYGPPNITKIDSRTDAIAAKINTNAGYIAINGDVIYFTAGLSVKRLNTKSGQIDDFLPQGVITTPNGITTDPETGDIYISDAMNFIREGKVFCFDKNGNQRFSFTCGLRPRSILIVK